MDTEWDYVREIWAYIIGEEDVAAGMVAKFDMVAADFDCDHPVVHMCGGMPLALVCMFSALAKEQEQQGLHVKKASDVQDRIWEKVKRNGIQNTPGFEPLVESLQLGYIHLPHHMLKTCLLYCCIYPEGREIERGHLMRRWTAERFVCKEEIAKGYFEELVNRGLIPFVKKRYSENYGKYRVHPVMRNFLRCKLREDNFITCSSDIPASYACRIRLLCIDEDPMSDSGSVTDDGPMSEIDWSHIRSLVVFGSARRARLGQLKCLRVLDLQFNEGLENDDLKDMCGLFRVRHLFGLRGRFISEIPPEIRGLQHLETLEVRGTRITGLPVEIGKLQHLKNLDLKQNEYLKEVPRVIRDLQHLENLSLNTTGITELPREIITRLPQLRSLDVSRNPKITELPSEIWNLQHLRTLNLGNTQITQLPREVANLQNLETLNLNRTRIRKLPREIGKLQHLESLNLYLSLVRKIPMEMEGLNKLKSLVTDGFNALPWEAAKLSRLLGLPEGLCQIWKNSDVVSSLAGEILHLKFTQLLGLTIGTKQMRIPRWIKDHFSDLGTLDIRVCKLEEDGLKILREMPNLQILDLYFEVVPREPVAIRGGGFPRLMRLTIDSRVPRVFFQEGAMPMLEWLVIVFQFYAGPPNRDPVGINHLTELSIVQIRCEKECYSADAPCISATIDVLREEAWEHRNDVLFSVTGYRSGTYAANKNSADILEEVNDACSSETGEFERGGEQQQGEMEEERSQA
nr:disease resistance protein Pikm1-TS-like [Aegilops tauschii subsp. strangulata]